MLFLALPWVLVLILLEINFGLVLPSYPNKSFGKRDQQQQRQSDFQFQRHYDEMAAEENKTYNLP